MPERLDATVMAMRVASEFFDGAVVNLGSGLPLRCCNYVPEEREVLFHSEQGIVGFGPIIYDAEKADPTYTNANGHPVTALPGMALMAHDESFAMIRGGHIDISVLGALQVGANGDLANSRVPGKLIGSLGGAQDLATCARKLIIMMYHTTADGRPKVVRECDLVLTARSCVDIIVTDVAVMDVTQDGIVLKECAPGWSPAAIQAITDAELIITDTVAEMRLV
jgi:3-oxoacid CoA-transferase subunit B